MVKSCCCHPAKRAVSKLENPLINWLTLILIIFNDNNFSCENTHGFKILQNMITEFLLIISAKLLKLKKFALPNDSKPTSILYSLFCYGNNYASAILIQSSVWRKLFLLLCDKFYMKNDMFTTFPMLCNRYFNSREYVKAPLGLLVMHSFYNTATEPEKQTIILFSGE